MTKIDEYIKYWTDKLECNDDRYGWIEEFLEHLNEIKTSLQEPTERVVDRIKEIVDNHLYYTKEDIVDELLHITLRLKEPTDKKSEKCPGCGVEGIGCICAILNPIS